MNINPELMKLAEWRINELEKEAFQPPMQSQAPDPSQAAQGGGGMDPSMMAAMAGGAPGGDPSAAMGGAGGPTPVPGAGGLDADSIRQIVQQTMQSMQGGGAGGGIGPGGKPVKPDITTMATDMWQLKKMITALFNQLNIPLPTDILDGPGRDLSTGLPAAPGSPNSTSNINNSGDTGQQQQQQSAIPPVQPMDAAVPQAPKQAAHDQDENAMVMGQSWGSENSNATKASALMAIYNQLRNN